MRKKIMIVDDSSTILMMQRMILSKGPYDLVLAKDGQEAVERAPVEKPDLILLDVMMPRLGGLEACKRLRESEPTTDVPIIMVTTRGQLENVETAFGNGCNDYITKPINGVELLTKVRHFLG
jgi:DNA-binding response OmpR family regulator